MQGYTDAQKTELTPKIYRLLNLVKVRLQLNYAVQAVAPYLQKRFEACGNDAKACDAMRDGLCGLQYLTRLRELQLPSIQRHILRAVLIRAYNLLHGYLNLPLA